MLILINKINHDSLTFVKLPASIHNPDTTNHGVGIRFSRTVNDESSKTESFSDVKFSFCNLPHAVPVCDLPSGSSQHLPPVVERRSRAAWTSHLQSTDHLVLGDTVPVQQLELQGDVGEVLSSRGQFEHERFVEDRLDGALLHVSLFLHDSLALVEQVDLHVRIAQAGEVHPREVPRLQHHHREACGGGLVTQRQQQLAPPLGPQLGGAGVEVPGELQAPSKGQLPQGHKGLPHGVVPRVPVERQDREVHRNVLDVCLRDAVEGEVLVVGGVEGAPEDTRLGLVVLVWQQLQLHVRVPGGRLLSGVLAPANRGQSAAPSHAHHQRPGVSLVP